MNVDFVPFIRGEHSSLTVCEPRPEKAAAYYLSYKWGYGPIVIDHLRKFVVDKHLDHSFGMLAVSFQLLTWCTDSAEDLILIYLSQLMLIEIHNHCSFVFKMSLGQQKSVFLNLKPYKTSLKLLRKKIA